MKKIIFFLIYIIFLQIPIYAEDVQDNKTIWDYTRDDFVSKSLFSNDEDSFFVTKKQEYIDKELERLLDVKLVHISLEECLKLAVLHNYEIKSKTATERSNYWYKKNAYTKFLPEAQYDFILQRLSGLYVIGGILPDRVNETPMQSTFEFSWDAFNRGRTFFEVSQRRSLYRASVLEKNFTREEIILKTAVSYYELLRNKAEVDIYATNVIDRKSQYDLTKARYNVGVGTKFDIYRSEAELEKAKQQYITSFNSIRMKQAELANLTGINVLVPLYPKDNIIKEKKLTDIDTCELVEISHNRKDILALQKRIDAMKAVRSSQYMDFVPNIGVNYQYANNGTAKLGLYPSHTFTVTAIAPLGSRLGFETITRIKAQSAEIKAKEYDLIQKKRDVEEAVINSTQKSESALKRITASRKEVYAAEKSLESSIVLMNSGVSSFIDVIQAQALKVNSQVGLAQNITDYNIAQVRMLFDAGIISIDSVLNGVD